MATDLEWAVHQSAYCYTNEYKVYKNYYEGNHALAFATEKFRNTFGIVFKEFAENLCAPVVDSLSDRLEITGFRASSAELKIEEVAPTPSQVEGMPNRPGRKKITTVDPIGEACMDIWAQNRMDERANEVHIESLKMGDAYVIVWPNDVMEPEIWPQDAMQCRVQYNSDNRKKVDRALKVWWVEEERHWYLNVYTDFGITKYRSRQTTVTMPSSPDAWVRFDFVPNIYGSVPVFHFPTRRSRRPGMSELRDIIPLQNALNKAVMDMIIAMEFASFKQRWVVGLEVDVDEETGEPRDPLAKNHGVDRLLTFPDPEVKIGQFDATDLGQFLEVQDKFWASASRISGTPLHYFYITSGDFPSGEAMKSAESRFVKKITDRQTAFGNVWEDVLKFCLQIQGQPVAPDVQIKAEWVNAAPRSESELADTAVKKQAVGVSRSQNLRELGYTDEEIQRMLEESDADSEWKAALKAGPEDEEGTNPNGQPRPRPSGTSGVRR